MTESDTGRRVDVWADHIHYLDHVAPIWHALPDSRKGLFIVPNRLLGEAARRGIDALPLSRISGSTLRWSRNIILVCAWGGVLRWRKLGRPIVLLNHGAGQTGFGGHPAYSGGYGRECVAMFIEPGPHAAEATLATLPDADVAVVGCAKMDDWHSGRVVPQVNDKPVIAFSTHWDCKVSPEARSCWPVYGEALLALKDRYSLLAHAHPLIAKQVRADAEAAGVEYVDNFEDVLVRADLYIADSSSTLYEFASTGRPVLCLNRDSYRRHVHHGLRFWDAVPGIQCDSPEELPSKVVEALADSSEAQALRNYAVGRAYVACDGNASQRAADSLVRFAERLG